MNRDTHIPIAALLVAAAAMIVLHLFPQDGDSMPTLVDSVRAAGPWAHASVALGVACVFAATVGALAPRLRSPSLVRLLGHGAFVLGLAGAATAFDAALGTAERIGPGVTPADFADSTDAALASMVVAAVAEAVALGCAGVLRLRAPRPPLHL